MDETKFCSECGREVESGMQFCPYCGKVISGTEAAEDLAKKRKEFESLIQEGRRNWLIFLLAIYAIPVICIGLFYLFDAGTVAESLFKSDEFKHWMESHGYDFSVDDLITYITAASSMAIISGACAVASLICILKRRMWVIAVGACFAAALLCFWSIFGIIIGFLVAWMIFGSKDIFNDTDTE